MEMRCKKSLLEAGAFCQAVERKAPVHLSRRSHEKIGEVPQAEAEIDEFLGRFRAVRHALRSKKRCLANRIYLTLPLSQLTVRILAAVSTVRGRGTFRRQNIVALEGRFSGGGFLDSIG